MFRRFFEEGLAQTSYLLACDRTRQAVVIDPRRDISAYAAVANASGLTITHAIDTHIHADFVSGSRELAALGAEIIAGPGADHRYDHRQVAHGSSLRLGDLDLTALHTPGHTPEHLSIVARHPGEPPRVFTGDTLLVGAVGRPDLLGDAVMRGLAEQLHHSVLDTLMQLADEMEVWPGHGAGSLCGSGIGEASHTTIGDERRTNPLLRHTSRDQFVEEVLSDLPDTAPYFSRMKRLNHEGAPVLGLAEGVGTLRVLEAAGAAAAARDGAWILDLRSAEEYAAGHPRGSIGVAAASKVGYWAAWVLPPATPVVLLAPNTQRATEARRQLLTVGIDDVAGWIAGGFEAWGGAGLPVARTPLIAPGAVQSLEQAEPSILIDVRSRREWDGDHIAGARHLPLQELAEQIDTLPRGPRIATICEGGARSALAAGLLERAGFDNLAYVAGGMAAWRPLDRPAVRR